MHTDIDSIVLSFLERRLLKRIEREGDPYNEATRENKRIKTLYTYGLIKICVDDRFPSNGINQDGNWIENAYRSVDFMVSRYWLNRRKNFWPELRNWIAICISAAALIISTISLLMQIWCKYSQL